MTRRRFQFSLRVAIVTMVLASVAIGVYVRWPYYVAGRLLDEADGDKTFPEWPAVRAAFVSDKQFREWAVKPHEKSQIECRRNDTEGIVTLYGDAVPWHGQEFWHVRLYGKYECYKPWLLIPGAE